MSLLDVTRGDRPDVTPNQIIGSLLAAIPCLLVLFGVELTDEKMAALGGLVAIGASLIGGDAYLRAKRNMAAAMQTGGGEIEAAGELPVPEPEPPVPELATLATEVPFEVNGGEPGLDEGEFEHEDDDPTGEEHVPEDVTVPAAAEDPSEEALSVVHVGEDAYDNGRAD